MQTQTRLLPGSNIDLPIRASDFYLGGIRRSYISQSPNVKHLITHPRNGMAFILTTNKTIVIHNSNVLIIKPVEVPGKLWERRYYKIRSRIRDRKICTIYDLFSECSEGIEMVSARLEWYV